MDDKIIYGYIYCITDKNDTTRQYIGQTKRNVEERINEHFRRKSYSIFGGLDKDNYDIKTIRFCYDRIELNERERELIYKYGTLNGRFGGINKHLLLNTEQYYIYKRELREKQPEIITYDQKL